MRYILKSTWNEHLSKIMVSNTGRSIRIFDYSWLSHFDFRLLYSEGLEWKCSLPTNCPICLSSHSINNWLIIRMFRVRRGLNKMEDHDLIINQVGHGLIGSTTLWALKKRILVWLSTRYWKNKSDCPKTKCYWSSSYISYTGRNGMGIVKSRNGNRGNRWNGL